MIRITLLQVGKTKERYLEEGLRDFQKKLKPYLNFEEITLKEAPYKNLPPEQAKAQEGAELLKRMKEDIYWIVLDERGKELSSRGLAGLFETQLNQSRSHFGLVIGGAFGLSEEVKKRADLILRLSKMTFTHQMIRLFLAEQLYRAMTILKGEKYHND